MKHLIWWLLGGGALIALYLWYVKSQAAVSATTATAATAAGNGPINQLQSFLGSFGKSATANSTTAINGAYGNLQAISTAFGAAATGNGVQFGDLTSQTTVFGNGPASMVDDSGLDTSDDGDFEDDGD
jgi:hypothetical protein